MTQTNGFSARHIGPRRAEVKKMLAQIGATSLNQLIDQVVPAAILDRTPMDLPEPVDEMQALAELRALGAKNKTVKSLIGQGYYGTFTPPVIQRNVLENPSWYTAYTPYQPEISQGRLEVLFNFQTMVAELTGFPVTNASMLDEATAAAEAVALCHRALRGKRQTLLVSENVFAQTLDVIRTRAEPLSIDVQVVNEQQQYSFDGSEFALLLQSPDNRGVVRDYTALIETAHAAGCQVIVATDLLALTLQKNPAEMGADVAVGSAQRFGVPMGFGGPHAAFFATSEKHKRSIPGRLVGLSIDAHGNPAYRLALQTREQHIRREKATSNICTAQALLAIMATFYAGYHGADGLSSIARQLRKQALFVADSLRGASIDVSQAEHFDTLCVTIPGKAEKYCAAALQAGYNLHCIDTDTLTISFDETCDYAMIEKLLGVFGIEIDGSQFDHYDAADYPAAIGRQSVFLSQAAFNDYRSETDMMRYMKTLANRDIALDTAMIPLGSCTMKLNAAAEMAAVTWPEFSQLHPFAPADQTMGYQQLIADVEAWLCTCTGYDAVSLQPNAGSQGEYAGLLAIKRYHESRSEAHRDVCLIPQSAHGTNPASAQMCGMRVVVVACDDDGNVDIESLTQKIAENNNAVAAIMITYPSTHGVFEEQVQRVCELVHDAGGQVYIDGANLNAMVGLARPGKFGGDVSHLNLHKTFCIPHGGGGPGVGPIGVGAHLAPFLPGHRHGGDDFTNSEGAVSAAPWGSALILTITWMYIRMMGASGLRAATEHAILSANYIANRLAAQYSVLYTGANGRVAHECILDTRKLKDESGVTVEDIAKRLIDYGFHAPTMSFPVAGTLMIEPTESEPLREIDRFCSAMSGIYREHEEILARRIPADDNPLCNAPHTARVVTADEWNHPYPRELAAYPDRIAVDANKYWVPVGRVDNVHGDKNLVCTCPPMEAYDESLMIEDS